MDRSRAVELLLRDFLAYLPRARQSSDVIGPQSGLAPGRSVPCQACGQRGRVLAPGKSCPACPSRMGPEARSPAFFANVEKGVRISTLHGCKPCLNCKGTGWKAVSIRKGEIGTEWDEYSGTRHSERQRARDTKVWEREQSTARQLRHSERLLALWSNDRCPHDIDLSQRECPHGCRPLEVAWEERRQQQWRKGSYARLAHALRYVQAGWPRRYSLVWRVYVLQEDILLSPALQEKLAETIAWVAKLMPTEIRVPAHIARELALEEQDEDQGEERHKPVGWLAKTPAAIRERAERDEEIRRLRFEEQWKISRLARHFALSERMIKQIAVATATVAA